MLPDFLAGSYKKYKQDTALFTTWLAQAAAACGYKPKVKRSQDPDQSVKVKSQAAGEPSGVSKPTLSSTGRLKGKERKAAKDAADKEKKQNVETSNPRVPSTVKYTVTTGELLRQAEAVVQSHIQSHVKLPASLQSIVERAIRARQRCSEWFQKSGVQNKYADKQHTHFIEILKQSLTILEPCVEAKDSGQTRQENSETSLKGTDSTTNRFAALKVEESPDVDLLEGSEVTAAAKVAHKPKDSKGEDVIAVYELEDEDGIDEDLAFIIFCQCFSIFRVAILLQNRSL